MAKIVVHSGDFRKGGGHRLVRRFGPPYLRLRTDRHRWLGERLELSQLAMVEHSSEERIVTTLLASIKNVTFIATFKDGRRLVGTTDERTFATLHAGAF